MANVEKTAKMALVARHLITECAFILVSGYPCLSSAHVSTLPPTLSKLPLTSMYHLIQHYYAHPNTELPFAAIPDCPENIQGPYCR
jgi:hypothetical protein